MNTDVHKSFNPNRVYHIWQEDDELWYGSLMFNGKWYFNSIGNKKFFGMERELNEMAGVHK